ncbi:MAG: hypothetical protein HY691_16130 [Chloroflexi bacterium]|nr:hypothetical protein [Chloroflexota bacterium]
MGGVLHYSTRRLLRLAVALAAVVALFIPLHGAHAQAPVQVVLADEGLDAAGRWFQRFRITIGPGGSLTLASEMLFGDQLHADELFTAAKQANPALVMPSNIPVGQEIVLTVDPRSTYLIRERSVDQTRQTRRLVYTNGAQRTIYLGTRTGVLQEIVFPNDRPAREFVYADDQGQFAVASGGRVVDYVYAGGELFGEVVGQLFGDASVLAMQNFIVQTGWDPNRWPPPQNERRRLVVGPAEQYRDERPAPLSLQDVPPQSRAALQQQLAERARLGLYATAFDGTRVTYRALITDPAVTAKRVAAALYGDEARWLQVAKVTGLEVEEERVKGLPPGTDPILLGRSFALVVDLAEERFPAGPPRQEGGRRITALRNGTVVEDYPIERQAKAGLARIVRYPSGYKRIVYRPDPLWLFALDFMHFQGAFLRGATRDESVRDRQGRGFTAQVLWLLLRDLPREGDVEPLELTISDAERGKVLDVVTRPRAVAEGEPPAWLAPLQEQPALAAAGATLAVALLLAIVFGLLRRPIGAGTRIALARRRPSRR